MPLPLDTVQVLASTQEAAGASRDTLGVVGLELQEGSAAGFIAKAGLPVADGISGGRSQREEVVLSKHSRSSSEKGSATSEPSRRPSAERHCRKDQVSHSDSSVNSKSRGPGDKRSLLTEPIKSESLKNCISIKKENRIVTVSSKTINSKPSPLERSESDTLGSDLECQERVHSSTHLT